MSVLLLGSSIVTTTLIDPVAMRTNGEAEYRALAYIAHGQTADVINPLFGEVLGTAYDLSTVAILWFAGASAMSGLLNLVPRYPPRYGMAPKWAEATRPLVLVFTAVNLVVTSLFAASVGAQGGAYATGVLVLMTSACVATVIDQWRRRTGDWPNRFPWNYALVAAVFFYTTAAVIYEKPTGMQIAAAFILAVLLISIISRLRRSTELRFDKFEFVDEHSRFLWDAMRHLEFPVLVPHRPGHHTMTEKDESIRRVHRIDPMCRFCSSRRSSATPASSNICR